MRPINLFFLSCLLFCCAVAAQAQSVGQVVGLRDQASVLRDGQRIALRRGTEIHVGDRVRTNRTGQVQIVFADRTRLAVGPSSRIVIKDIELSTAKRASRFILRALGGTYRMLTGDSPSDVYEIQTFTGHLGVRGTEFDLTQVGGLFTAVVSHGGSVALNGRFGGRAILSGGCKAVVLADRSFSVPPSDEALGALLARDFPLIVDQTILPTDFQLNLQPCPPLPATPRGSISLQERLGLPFGNRNGDFEQSPSEAATSDQDAQTGDSSFTQSVSAAATTTSVATVDTKSASADAATGGVSSATASTIASTTPSLPGGTAGGGVGGASGPTSTGGDAASGI